MDSAYLAYLVEINLKNARCEDVPNAWNEPANDKGGILLC
jgi:hypothetical protein